MISRFLNILFPEFCPVCKNPSNCHKTAPICLACWQVISPYKGPICRKCGKPLASDVSIICSTCIKDAPAFEWVRSFGIYEGTLREAVNLLKYKRIKRLSRLLSKLMLNLKIPQAHAIIPVPLFKRRLRQREFNHSALLAKHLADYTGIPLIQNCLIKVRDTRPQVGLSAKERRKNIRNAFTITDRQFLQKKDFILVDDVVTTGATVRECSMMMKKAGAKNIYVITLAHSSGDF